MEILNGWPIFFSNTAIVNKIDTIHYFHTTGWTARVYGARHLDFVDDRQTLEDMYREYCKSLTKNEERTESQEPHAFRLMRKYKQLKHPSMEFLGFSIEKFGNKYLQHFLTTKAGKMLNFEMGPTSNTDSSLFDVCFETIFASFSFNDEVKFWKLGNEVSSQGQFVTQATSLHDFRLLYNNVNIELRSCSDRKIRVTSAKSGITSGVERSSSHEWCQIWHEWPVFSDPNNFEVQYLHYYIVDEKHATT